MSKDYSDYTNRCLFTHIAKTGGSSIAKAPFILKHGSQEQAPNSEFIMSLRFRFSFVRNPYDRYASCLLNLGRATPETFEEYTLTTFKDGYKEGFAGNNPHWQNMWPAYKHLYFDGKLECDFVGRFEGLESDWGKVCDMMDEDFKLPHLNSSSWGGYGKYYSKRTRQIVSKAYEKDFDTFGYQK